MEIPSNWKTAAPNLMLPMMSDLIDKTMNESDEDIRWVHQKYGICQIVPN